MKFFKKVIVYGSLTWLGFFVYKKFTQSKEVCKLGSSLPKYLETVVEWGTKTNINLPMGSNSLEIKVGIFQKEFDKDEIESIITEYIEDFYPALAKLRLNIDLYSLEKPEEAESNEGCCCDDNCGDDECTCNDEPCCDECEPKPEDEESKIEEVE